MKRFVGTDNSSAASKNLPPVDLLVEKTPVSFIGPATRENPMAQVRTKLMGMVVFHDRKIKWNRITLQLTGKAGLNVDAPTSTLPREATGHPDMNGMTNLQTTVTVCQVEKELIFTGEEFIDFGLHLPTNLPPSIRTKHAFVEYTLVANFSGGSFFKKYRIQQTVNILRHYLPSPSALIPSIESHGVREWLEWSVEVPKACAIDAREVVLALRWSVEKECVEVDRVELALEELETYRFSTKSGLFSLPPIITTFPATVYHPSPYAASSETHFIRTPIHVTPSSTVPQPLRPHHFDPFLEISHRCRLTIHFTASATQAKPLTLEFPIIITDYPAHHRNTQPDVSSGQQPPAALPPHDAIQHNPRLIHGGGDDAIFLDLDLPEYTPRYEQVSAE